MPTDANVAEKDKCSYCEKALGTNVSNVELMEHLINECSEIGLEERKMLQLDPIQENGRN